MVLNYPLSNGGFVGGIIEKRKQLVADIPKLLRERFAQIPPSDVNFAAKIVLLVASDYLGQR
jgi:hypothetical protein